MNAMKLAAFASIGILSSGCFHVTTRVPGVLDVRTDGSRAPAIVEPLPPDSAMTRAGVDGLLFGAGATNLGASVAVDDRKIFFLNGLVPILNESSTEEIRSLLGKDALKDVSIGDSETIVDTVFAIFCRQLPVLGLFVPTVTVTMSGKRIRASAGEPPAPTSPLLAPPELRESQPQSGVTP